MVGRVPEVARHTGARPLRKGEQLLIGRLRASEALVLHDHVRLVGVNIDAEAVSLGTDIADIDRGVLGDLALDAEVPIVGVGRPRIRIDSIPPHQPDRGSAGRLGRADHQGNVLIERQVPGVSGGRLSQAGALSHWYRYPHALYA